MKDGTEDKNSQLKNLEESYDDKPMICLKFF